MRHLLRDRAQDEERKDGVLSIRMHGRDGGTRQTQKESPTKTAGSEDEKHTSESFVATDIGKGFKTVIVKKQEL